jgi:predicted nucleic acid-binding protein
MIGLDTNVIVRYLAQDDPTQSALAEEFIESVCSEKRPAFINHIVYAKRFGCSNAVTMSRRTRLPSSWKRY